MRSEQTPLLVCVCVYIFSVCVRTYKILYENSANMTWYMYTTLPRHVLKENKNSNFSFRRRIHVYVRIHMHTCIREPMGEHEKNKTKHAEKCVFYIQI